MYGERGGHPFQYIGLEMFHLGTREHAVPNLAEHHLVVAVVSRI